MPLRYTPAGGAAALHHLVHQASRINNSNSNPFLARLFTTTSRLHNDSLSSSERDHYETLEVSPNATPAEIKKWGFFSFLFEIINFLPFFLLPLLSSVMYSSIIRKPVFLSHLQTFILSFPNPPPSLFPQCFSLTLVLIKKYQVLLSPLQTTPPRPRLTLVLRLVFTLPKSPDPQIPSPLRIIRHPLPPPFPSSVRPHPSQVPPPSLPIIILEHEPGGRAAPFRPLPPSNLVPRTPSLVLPIRRLGRPLGQAQGRSRVLDGPDGESLRSHLLRPPTAV